MNSSSKYSSNLICLLIFLLMLLQT